MRIGDVLALRWQDVDLDAKKMTVRHNLWRGSWVLLHLDSLRSLLEDFVNSPMYGRGDDGFHEFLLRYGGLEPNWALTQVETILRQSDVEEKGFTRLGEEELSRCVLRLYNFTPSNTHKGQEFRSRAMDVFGELMEKSPFDSDRILKEWDEGHDGRFL